jgi:hypothetical protein
VWKVGKSEKDPAHRTALLTKRILSGIPPGIENNFRIHQTSHEKVKHSEWGSARHVFAFSKHLQGRNVIVPRDLRGLLSAKK